MFRLPALRPRKTSDSKEVSVVPATPVRRRPDSLGMIVSAFESETQGVFLKTAPRNEHLVLYTLAGMLVLAVVLMAVLKLDRVVTGTGRIVPTQGSIYVQSFSQAIIRAIKVKVGDVVHKGQVLATLDPTFSNATLSQTQAKLDSDHSLAARLQAEVDNKPYAPDGSGPYDRLQLSIWHQRQSEYQSQVLSYDSQVLNAEATIGQYEKDIEGYTSRLGLATQLETMDETLEQKGYGSRLKTLASTDTRVEEQRLLADAQNQMAAERQTASSLKAQRAAYVEKWHSDAGTDLVNARNDLDKTEQDLNTAKELKSLTSVVAPADAVVVKIGKASTGSVTGPPADSSTGTDALFTLMPLTNTYEADVDIESLDEGFVAPGEKVRIKLDAYRYMVHGVAKGVIKSITQESFRVDQDTNQPRSPYVQARIAITDAHLRNVPSDFRLVPGMTVVADVVVGRRTILSYLVEGAMRTGSEAMREP